MNRPTRTPVPHVITRRRMLGLTGVSAAGVALTLQSTPWMAEAAEAPSPAPIAPLNRFPRMVQEHFVHRLRQIEAEGIAARSKLKTKADAEAYVRSVRQRIQTAFGPFPAKTPLNARITGVVERDAYRIEKIIFESRPGFPVTANLYIPKNRKFPLPAVVGVCGHSSNGKAVDAYQSFSQGLARQGYVMLIIDPIGQGERFQYTNDRLTSRLGAGVREHLQAGNQQFLVGEFLGSWRAWDGIRALDYLLTRPEVDPDHVGVTGNSGGGTLTTWLCGLDSRWTMAAPSCFVTTFLRNMENELPADTEQCPPRCLALGLDHADFLAAMAPKPIIVLGKQKDFFDVRGTEEAFNRLQHLYKLLGRPYHIRFFAGPTVHGYSQENREAMYKFFNDVTGISNPPSEPALTIEKDETLWCTPRGQVAELNPRTVQSFTREASQQLAAVRSRVGEKDVGRAIAGVLHLPVELGPAPDYRILRTMGSRRYPSKGYAMYAVETEQGVHALVTMLADEMLTARPPKGRTRAVLYISHQSADAELRDEPLVRELIKQEPDATFFACDVRGIGDSRPDTCGKDSFLTPYGSDYFYAIHSIMLDRPYAGQRTFDILRVATWLQANGFSEIHLAARDWGTIPATFAALRSDAVVQVTLKNALTSYSEIAETEMYDWPLSSFVLDVLRRFDLPDCYRALAKKKLRQIDPRGAA